MLCIAAASPRHAVSIMSPDFPDVAWTAHCSLLVHKMRECCIVC